ncbi:MAG: hypothetical protein ABEJ44_03855 [Halanaeroarchaeum sp.]
MPSYLNTEPDLDVHEEIIEEYPSESYLVRSDDPAVAMPTFRFHTPARPIIEFDDEERARLFADLYLALGGFRIKEGVGPNGIPVTVATSGKAAIASYMFSVWGEDADGDRLDARAGAKSRPGVLRPDSLPRRRHEGGSRRGGVAAGRGRVRSAVERD